MSKLIRTAPAFSPVSTETRTRPSGTQSPDVAIRRSAAAGWVLALSNLVALVLYWVPELSVLPGYSLVFVQLAPLVSVDLVSRGDALVLGQQGLPSALCAILLVGSIVLLVACRSPRWPMRILVLPLAVGLAVISVLRLVIWVGSRGWTSSVTGTLLLVVLSVTFLGVARRGTNVDVSRLRASDAHLGLLVAYAVVAPVPLAVGRLVAGGNLRDAAAGLPEDLHWSALDSSATVWLWLTGVAVGMLVWVLRALPVAMRTRRWGGVVAVLVLAVGPGLVLAGGRAAVESETRARVLGTGSPHAELQDSCIVWWRNSVPEHTIAITGSRCRKVAVYEGYDLDVQRTSRVSFGSFRNLETPEGGSITSSSVSGLYDSTLVALASSDGDKPDRVVGIGFFSGQESWRYSCGSGIVGVRLAGVPSGDNAGAGRKTRRGEGQAVVVRCGKKTIKLDPQTGRKS